VVDDIRRLESKNVATPDSGGASRKACPIECEAAQRTSHDRAATHKFLITYVKITTGSCYLAVESQTCFLFP
jgi:hypothetical protein